MPRNENSAPSERPVKGQQWQHRALRGVWTVQSGDARFVTVTNPHPLIKTRRIPTEDFMRAGWERVR